MIQKIIMEAVASYKDPVEILELKKFNLLYGLNGTGKTILSRYLANYQNPGDKFTQCKLEFVDKNNVPEILVYNEDFIKDNFLDADKLNGIFTIGKINVEAEQIIEQARTELCKLSDDKKLHDEKILEFQNSNNQEKNTLSEKIWKMKTSYEATSLKECMTGFRDSKEKFLENLLKIDLENIEEAQTIEQSLKKLERELDQLRSDDVQKKQLHSSLDFNLEHEETQSILTEIIIGSEDSYLSSMIEKLNHADWVNQGITHYLDKIDDCPFCVRQMDAVLKDKIKAHLDKTYQEKLEILKQLAGVYQRNKKDVEDALAIFEKDTILSDNQELKAYISQLKALLNGNAEKIKNKIKEPSQRIELNQTLEVIVKINAIITVENNKIENFNKKIDNKRQATQDIKKQFWQLLWKKYELDIINYKEHIEDNRKKIENVKKEIENIASKILYQNGLIVESQKKTKNVDSAIHSMNNRLRAFGMEGFLIKKMDYGEENVPFYMITRENDLKNQDTFRTLSEGEKTLITFLYFVEKCVGTNQEDRVVPASDRIIVIDDPISSLSFNLIFDIAILIKEIFLKYDTKYRQIFLFTHHLYFFHELHRGSDVFKSNSKYYRITKCEKTAIWELKEDQIKNDYQCYWQIIKDVKSGRASPIVLPNAMRNILEHYFSFVMGQDTLANVLDNLIIGGDRSLRAFGRFMQRKSHSDSINLTDQEEIDVDKFIKYFRNVFEETNFLRHYQDMMGEKPIIVQGNDIKQAETV